MTSTPPSFIMADGSQRWMRNGVLHRNGDKPAVINAATGLRMWFVNGYFNRDGDKPAIIAGDGSLAWYKHGNYQRRIDSDGSGYRGIYITHFEHNSLRYVFVLNVCRI